MATETTEERRARAPAPARPDADGRPDEEDRALRALATKQAERVRNFKRHVLLFPVGVVGLGLIWMLTEYFQNSTWPSRFADADNGQPDTWNPWFFYAVAVWLVILAAHAVRTYVRRTPSEAEIQREIDRINSSR